MAGIPPKAERYDHADDVVQTVLDLWDGWDPDALTLDAAARQFADPAKVSRVPRRGTADPLSRGPLTLPRSPQGRPVLMQAGSSDRGLEFAARWAEVVFAVADTAETMRAQRQELRSRATAAGRDPDDLVFLPAVQPIVGATRRRAQDTLASLVAELDEAEVLAKLGRLLHAGPDELDPSGSAEELLLRRRGATGSEGFERMLLATARREHLSVRDLATLQALSQLHPQPVDSPEGVADFLCELYESEAADGFVIMPALYQSSLEEFVNGVVPALQRRGRFRTSYGSPLLSERFQRTSECADRQRS